MRWGIFISTFWWYNISNMSFPSPDKMGSPSFEVPGFREPSDGTLRYRPYGAMPSNPYADEAIRQRQREIHTEFRRLYGFTKGIVPDGVAAMMQSDYDINEERRSIKNFDAYMTWLNTHQPTSQEIQQSLAYMERGKALVDELVDIGLQTNIESVELAKVTHPYGRRLEHVYPMREDVMRATENHGGVVYPSITPYRSIHIHPFTSYHTGSAGMVGELQGFIASYKRDIGHIATDDPSVQLRIVERQIAGFRVDEASGFPQEKIQHLLDSRADIHNEHSEAFDRHMRESGVRGFIEKAIQTDSLDAYVIPQSTTIFAYREALSPEEVEHKRNLARFRNFGETSLLMTIEKENPFKR